MNEVTRGPSRKAWVVGVAAGATTAAAGYVVYRYWLRDYLDDRWRLLTGSAASAWRILDSFGAASELSSTVMADLKAFLESDSDEVPRSVRQMLKLSRSPEFQQAVLCSTQSITEGVTSGLMRTNDRDQAVEERGQPRKGLVEVVLEKLFTEEGKGFASAVCSRMVRTLVSSLMASKPGDLRQSGSASPLSQGIQIPQSQQQQQQQQQQQPPWLALLVEALSTERGKDLVSCMVQTFAVNCIGTFIEKTSDTNMYHDMLTAASKNPELFKELSAHMVATMVKEGVHTWKSTGGTRPLVQEVRFGSSSTSCSSSPRAGAIPLPAFSETYSDRHHQCEVSAGGVVSATEVVEYLSRPEIRSMILDVTGVMTTKGMEAFLLVMFYKLFGAGQSSSVEILEVGSDGEGGSSSVASSRVLWVQPRVVASRALAVASVCLAVMLHYLNTA